MSIINLSFSRALIKHISNTFLVISRLEAIILHEDYKFELIDLTNSPPVQFISSIHLDEYNVTDATKNTLILRSYEGLPMGIEIIKMYVDNNCKLWAFFFFSIWINIISHRNKTCQQPVSACH